jgi:uncharacterized protein (DUF58 family)
VDRTARASAIPGARFVDPKILARIGSLDLLATTVVDGFINGLHRAPYFGASIDFAEHRGYVPGDDIRRVDWRLYARTDRYYVKEYEADSNANVTVLLDVSKSMKFGSRGLPKLEYSCYIAACLAYLAHRQRDRVGIITFDADVVQHVPASAKHFPIVLQTLDRALAAEGRAGALGPPLRKVAEHFRRRGILILISDFYEEPESVLESIKPLRFLGNDLMVFHVLDPAEIDFTYDEPSSFRDVESGDELPVIPESFAAQYRALVQEHVAALRTRFSEHRIDYTLMNTGEPLDRALFSYLSTRERLSRVR